MTKLNRIDKYLGRNDWEIRENSNLGYSLQGLNVYITEKQISDYWLNEVYPKDVSDAHRSGDFHIHDLGSLSNYCCGWDLVELLRVGFRGVRGKTESKPARHFRVAALHIVNFLYSVQNEVAGAVAFSNVDTLLAPFIREDKLTYDEIKQNMQEFIFNLNVSTRQGGQPTFSNFSLDLTVPNHMKDIPAIVGGKPLDYTYGDLQVEVDLFNKAFAEVLLEGDGAGRPFTFPVPTYNLTKDFDWDNPNYDPIWEVTSKFGSPTFSNFINSDLNPEDVRSFCCRLQLDLSELKHRGGGLFGSAPLTGSIGVCTINLPRIGFEAEDPEEFFETLTYLMWKAKDSLEIKRKFIEEAADNGLYPYSAFYLNSVKEATGGYWSNHFATIGILGMNDAVYNMFGESIMTDLGKEFAVDVLEHMREVLTLFQKETGNLYNLEASPAEGSSFKLALKDKKKHPEIGFYNTDVVSGSAPYYTNCVSNDTECLTENGWKAHEDISVGDSILTMNLKTKELEYKEVLIMNEYTVENADMYSFKGKRQDQLVTPSHMVLFDGSRTGRYYLSTPSNLPKTFIVPMAGKYSAVDTRVISDDYIRLIGWIVSEGHFEVDNNGIRITQAEWANKDKFDEIDALLTRLGFKYSVLGDKRGRSIFRIAAADGAEIRKNVPQKRIPRWCLNRLPSSQMEILKDTLMAGDGTTGPSTSVYYTGDEQLADEFQELCLKIDIAATVRDYIELTGAYHITPARHKNTDIGPGNTHKVSYTGIVWCPTTENHTWVARRKGCPFITGNSTHLPADNGMHLFDALDHQDDLQTLYTGGTVFHSFLGEKAPDIGSLKALVKKIATNCKLPYFSITPTFSICKNHGYIAGEELVCPDCGERCEIYSRVTGFIRPIENFNDGKLAEFMQRTNYTVDGEAT